MRRLIDNTIRSCLPGLGVGRRWLKEQLITRGVTVRLTDGCLNELLSDAHEASVRLLQQAQSARVGYIACLREHLADRAEFIRRWTRTDERFEDEEGCGNLVKIARKYALPRPWKLSDPVATECERPRPAYWLWTAGRYSGEIARTA